jgi:UDP-glucose 4-epimerase
MTINKVLVTGGAGFVGSHLSERLIALGYDVHIFDDLSTGNIKNVPAKAKLHILDIRDRDKVHEIFAEEHFPVIFHQAAQMSVLRSVKRPVMDASINVLGTLNLLEAGKDNNLQKIIFASSGGVIYGNPNQVPQDENHPLEPISPYGISKLSAERYLRYFWENQGIAYIALRYANICKGRQSPSLGRSHRYLYVKNKGRRTTVIYGSGNKTRDYIFVSDVEANLKAMDHHGIGAFNIGTGTETNVNTVFRLIRSNLNLDIPEVHSGEEAGEQLRSVLDITKAKKFLNWQPKVKFPDGLKLTIDWYLNQK